MSPSPDSRLLIALLGSVSAALAPSSAHADPQVPAGAICNAVAPAFTGSDSDSGPVNIDPTSGLEKAQQVQRILARLQQNGGLTSGDSGDRINDAIGAAQNGDIGGIAGAGAGIAGIIVPQVAGEVPKIAGRGNPDDSDDSTQDDATGQDSTAQDQDSTAQQPAQQLQNKTLIDSDAIANMKNSSPSLIRQYCDNVNGDQGGNAADPDGAP